MMLATEEKKVDRITCTLAELADAFREEAEEVSSSRQEAEILASAALLNFLVAAKPDLFEPTSRIIRKAAIVSSLS